MPPPGDPAGFSKGKMAELILARAQHLKEAHGIDAPVSHLPGYSPAPREADGAAALAWRIDHTLLAQDATPQAVERLCEEARRHNFRSVCVNPCYALLAVESLKGTKTAVCCVVGFPLGAATTECKAFEAGQLVEAGVKEIDMVLNCGWMKAGMYKEVLADVKAVAAAVHARGAILKVIIEATCLETDELIIDACLLSAAGGADFVKTSTGMHKNGGARPEHVRLMRLAVGDALEVKAAGGIRDPETAKAMLQAGADRLGTSSGVKLCQE